MLATLNESLKKDLVAALDKGLRYDERKLDEHRPVTVETGVSHTAEGSARVTIGETEVWAGVKLSIGTPFPDKPDDGVLMVSTELLPLASPEFESGPPRIGAIELARVIDRGIREAGTIDTKDLVIEKGEKVWMVSVDLVPFNDAGNLWDACGIAALAALQDARFPKYEDGELNYKEHTDKKLELQKVPVPLTVIKIGDHIVVDPSNQEEAVADARLTVTTMQNNEICALQKGGDEPLSLEDIEKMVSLALDKAKELRKQVA